MIRRIYLFILIPLVGCGNLIEQQSKIAPISQALKNYQKYFSSNQNILNPIEGIWREFVVGTLYEDGNVIQRKEVRNRATWIIIKKGGKYQVLNDYGEQNKYIASFKQGSKKDTYTFNCLYLESKDRIITEARLVNNNRIEMAYDAPQGVIEENYREFVGMEMNRDPEKKLELHWQFNWLKSFPVD
ncbi:MAG: hypothetical protein U9N31_08450 [Candidatus Marinimicrobia bacterium]|nr:hypothetical protein [Candidatus Neomarinimicrobiota bacterium]